MLRATTQLWPVARFACAAKRIDDKRQPVDERDSDPFDVAEVPKLE
jgi:hypothetical protein